MIYGRWGDEVKVLRVASEADVKKLQGPKLDDYDRKALASGSYVVTKAADENCERLAHVGYMRATDGWAEIDAAIKATGGR